MLPKRHEVGWPAESVDHAAARNAERARSTAVINRRLHGLTPNQGSSQGRVERIASSGRVDGLYSIGVEVPESSCRGPQRSVFPQRDHDVSDAGVMQSLSEHIRRSVAEAR